MKIRLFTAGGVSVHEAQLNPHKTPPEVVVWHNRTFVYRGVCPTSDEQWYYEGQLYLLRD
jgi:hypothetical protein